MNYDKSLKIKIRQATKTGYIELDNGGVVDLTYVKSKTRRGRVQGNGHVAPAVTSQEYEVFRMIVHEEDGTYEYYIRKLTPTECCRAMDFNSGAAEKMLSVNSDTQVYKQAGNAIVVNCLVAILGQLFEGKEDAYRFTRKSWNGEVEQCKET